MHEDRRLSVLEENEIDAQQGGRSIIPQTAGHQGLFRPIPVLPTSQQKFRHSLVETYPNHMNSNDLIQWEGQFASNENQQKPFNFYGKTKRAQQLQKFYR